jgi:hypothetical protein
MKARTLTVPGALTELAQVDADPCHRAKGATGHTHEQVVTASTRLGWRERSDPCTATRFDTERLRGTRAGSGSGVGNAFTSRNAERHIAR